MIPRDSKIAEDMAYGQRFLIATTPDADMKEDTDYWLGGFCIALRRRRFSITKYNEISIRHSRKNGAKTEYQKIIDKESKAHVFIFEFLDAWVLCSAPTIEKALRDDIGYVGKWNHDGQTRAYYIGVDKIPHVTYPKNTTPPTP